MNNLKDFCQLFYASTRLPIFSYDTNSQRQFSFPDMTDEITLPLYQKFFFPAHEKYPAYLQLECFGLIGLIEDRKSGLYLIIGPVFGVNASEKTILSFIHELRLTSQHRDTVANFLSQVPSMALHQFLENLIFIHFCLNNQRIDARSHFYLAENILQNQITTDYTNQKYIAKEEQKQHLTYQFEQQYLACVRSGDVGKLNAFFSSAASPLKNAGKSGHTPVRNIRNLSIANTALVVRAAISGGMHVEDAYQLGDVYITTAETLQNVEEILRLQYTMALDFTKRVSKNKYIGGISKEITDCIQFISQHTNETIHVDDVAFSVGRSRSYISQKFKRELGFSMNDFIMNCKLEEAKSLLAYSDKTLSEISSYLCFSSQSYFQNVFKKNFGMTPLQYRKKQRI